MFSCQFRNNQEKLLHFQLGWQVRGVSSLQGGFPGESRCWAALLHQSLPARADPTAGSPLVPLSSVPLYTPTPQLNRHMRQAADWESQHLGSSSHWPYHLVTYGSGHSFLMYKMRIKEQCGSNTTSSSCVKGSENSTHCVSVVMADQYPVCMVATLGRGVAMHLRRWTPKWGAHGQHVCRAGHPEVPLTSGSLRPEVTPGD